MRFAADTADFFRSFRRISALALVLGAAVPMAACGEETGDSGDSAVVTGDVSGAETGGLNTGGNDALAVPAALGDMMMGDPDAPVTIIEYASLTCSHCAAFDTQNLPKLKEKYIQTGKVKYIFREYPLDPVATVASMLTRCVDESKYFGMLDVLFHQQRNWAFVDDPKSALQEIARQAGMSTETFEACITSNEILAGLRETHEHATKELKIRSTPTIFVNGERIDGNLPWEALEPMITKHLPESGESADQNG